MEIICYLRTRRIGALKIPPIITKTSLIIYWI